MAGTLSILVAAVLAFVSGRVPLAVVAVGVSLALWASGVLDLDQALAGFGDPTVLFIASLFVVSEALEATGVTAWAGSQVVRRAGTTRTAVLVAVCLLVAAVTAVITVNGAVAALIPMVVVIATRTGIRVSHLLLPLAFAAHAGSMLLLTGTPVNIIVSEAAADAGGRGFGFFEFGLVGVPLLAGTILLLVLLGRFLLPERSRASCRTTSPPSPVRCATSTPCRRTSSSPARNRGSPRSWWPPGRPWPGSTSSPAWPPRAATSSSSPSSAGVRTSPARTRASSRGTPSC